MARIGRASNYLGAFLNIFESMDMNCDTRPMSQRLHPRKLLL